MYLLGFDIGSSSVKVSLLDANNNVCVASASHPKTEMQIVSIQIGWAEQNPEAWWSDLKTALKECLAKVSVSVSEIKAIGISYQMHGLVCVDKNQNLLRNSIIWCDSRAVEIGEKALTALGSEFCLTHVLNSPGNFTASKLRWVKENEPALFEKIDKIMLPGDYIAMKLTGNITTTAAGLSEGIFWDFKNSILSKEILDYYQIPASFIPQIVPTFLDQGNLTKSVAQELGLSIHTKVSYRAGDQPNNAFSLNVMQPGEVAATAGTSGVIYAVSDKNRYDEQMRLNTFLHVNSTKNILRNGVLLCINGTGIQNSWMRNMLFGGIKSYQDLNEMTKNITIGSDNLLIYPFGNGAERVLGNKIFGGSIQNINFNLHGQAHIARAVQEGIVFGLNYGFEIMRNMGIVPKKVKAGHANMFLSPVFAEAFANTTQTVVELYNTDGSVGAARGAGIGIGFFATSTEAFENLNALENIEPQPEMMQQYAEVYQKWRLKLQNMQ